ncbi:MAG: hypothetical protein COA47_17430 [Robiginitomaculum sp.]|nr:MAG: hypothetical protein COA47_17430 [Robiginitomaculum sp.]
MSEVAELYFEHILGKPLEECLPRDVSCKETCAILWQLNDIFRPHIHRIRTLEYFSEKEEEADRAIEVFAFNPVPQAWDNISPGAWRVLLERQQQILVAINVNEIKGRENFTFMPADLPETYLLPGLMLLLLHGMKLPWPPDDRSNLELPEAPENLSLH